MFVSKIWLRHEPNYLSKLLAEKTFVLFDYIAFVLKSGKVNPSGVVLLMPSRPRRHKKKIFLKLWEQPRDHNLSEKHSHAKQLPL